MTINVISSGYPAIQINQGGKAVTVVSHKLLYPQPGLTNIEPEHSQALALVALV